MPVLTRARRQGRKFLNPVETTVGSFGMLLKVLRLYLQNKEERVPRKPLGPFHTDVSLYHSEPESGLRITWLGHSSMLAEIDGMRALIDPVWDQRASPLSWAGPRRFFAAPFALAELPPVDVVLVSHDHYDHLGKRTIKQLAGMTATASAKWVTSLRVGTGLRKLGVNAAGISELDWTESVTVKRGSRELTITALPARHFSGRGVGDRFTTLWSSFVINGARHKIYYGADSGLWDGFSAIAEQYGPFDLTMLEVGAYNELWKSIHMGPDGAIEAFSMMGNAGLLMPIHWGLFDLALHGWRQPIERITELAGSLDLRLWAPEPGRPTEVIAGQQYRSDWWRPA